MAGSMPQVSEGYLLGSCWIPIRPSHDSISDCHILAQLRGLLLQNGGSIPLRRQKDFRSKGRSGARLSPSVPSKLSAFSISKGPNWVICVGLTGPRRLPVYLGERTFSG